MHARNVLNYYEAPKTGNESPSLHRVLKPEAMDEYNRTICLENTRRDVINDIMEWIADDSTDSRKVLWVHGLAGTGKSTLSTTIAHIMRRHHRLVAFFFFNRDIPQRNFATLIRTLAYRLAMFDACFGAAISRVVENNDNIAEMPLEFQFESLLSANALKSVEWSGGPIVLIIDALDESGSEADRKILMQVLSKGFSSLPSFIRIIVLSRQEQDIQRVLGSHSHLRRYPLDIDSATNKDDLSEYMRHRLEEIRIQNGRLGDHWPSEDKISSLANRAGGLFIWASTACLYIESYAPNRRLSELLEKQPEGNSSGPFAHLDSLYETGLQSAGLWHDALFRSDCCNVLGMILCARVPLSCSVIDALLELPQDTSSWESVSRLGCVLHISETAPIRILHPSFHDYLSERCSSRPWSIQLERHNKELALRCIKLLDKELQENMCDMTLPYLSRKRSLPKVVCGVDKMWPRQLLQLRGHDSWVYSVAFSPDGSKIISGSNDKTIRVWDASTGIEIVPPIRGHDDSILSVAFSPDGSKIISGSADKTIRLWDASTGVEMLPPLRGHGDFISSVAFSPDGSKIISGSHDKTIRVWDANTGIEMLPPLRGHDSWVYSVAFSPDGSKIISGSHDKTFEFGMQTLASRCSHPSEAMISGFLPSHSRPMDQKSSRGRVTRPFEFGMQSLASRCSRPFEAMMTGLIPSHSRLMDPRSSRGQMTRPFESGMQALASRCSHPFEAMITGLIPSHSRPMDPKSSRGQLIRPFEFGMQALAL
jgi:WD40 repeat protein